MNANKALALLQSLQSLHPNDPAEDDIRLLLVDELGDDETDIIDFISSVSAEDALWMTAVYEEIIEKFPSDEMQKIFTDRVNL